MNPGAILVQVQCIHLEIPRFSMYAQFEAIRQKRLHHGVQLVRGWILVRGLRGNIKPSRIEPSWRSDQTLISDVVCPCDQKFEGGVRGNKPSARITPNTDRIGCVAGLNSRHVKCRRRLRTLRQKTSKNYGKDGLS